MMALNYKLVTKFLSGAQNVRVLDRQFFIGQKQVAIPFLVQSRRALTKSNLASTNTDHITTSSESSDGEKDKYSEQHRKRLGNYYSLLVGSVVGVCGSSYLIYKRLSEANAEASLASNGSEGEVSLASSGGEVESGSLHKSEAGFKERKIIEYENRIRAYSTPDKIFRYFASLQNSENGEIFMNPEDFVRSLTPDTMQPKGFGLDQFKKFDGKNVAAYKSKYFGEESIFHSFGEGGLISFSDYIFLLTVLGTSARHIDIAFKMFDLNGDGEVSLDEFKKVTSLFLSMSSTGNRHRDRKTTGNVLHDQVNYGLATYFFGGDGRGLLTSEDFVKFKRKLQEEVMYLEFNSFSPKNNTISEKQFAEILLTYANFHNAKRLRIIKRIKKVYGDDEKKHGVTFKDYLDFFNFLLNIRDVEMALSFHTVAGQPINKGTFKQVAHTVTGIGLTDRLIDIVFCIFDENEDGQLSNKEFVAVMKDKMFRGLNKPKDTGFTRFLSAVATCAKTTIMESWIDTDHKH